MKRFILSAALLLTLSCHAMPWDKKSGFVQANCKEKQTVGYTCCLYNQMEDSTNVNEWVSNERLLRAKKTCSSGGSNPCDCLGVGVHDGMTYSYSGSDMCFANSPVFVKKGETSPTDTVASICKVETASAEVDFQKESKG